MWPQGSRMAGWAHKAHAIQLPMALSDAEYTCLLLAERTVGREDCTDELKNES